MCKSTVYDTIDRCIKDLEARYTEVWGVSPKRDWDKLGNFEDYIKWLQSKIEEAELTGGNLS